MSTLVKRSIALMLAACICGAAVAQEKPADAKAESAKKAAAGAAQDAKKAAEDAKKPTGMPDEKAMAEMMALLKPGKHHKHLDAFVGKWNYELKWQMAPDAPAESSTGTSETKWVMDGMFIQDDTQGASEEPGMDGKPVRFRGLGLTGYDPIKEIYTSTWVDNMGPGMMISTGTCEADGKSFTFKGDMADPMTGEKSKKYRITHKVESADRHVMEMFIAGPDGKEFRNMVITYTRQGAKTQ